MKTLHHLCFEDCKAGKTFENNLSKQFECLFFYFTFGVFINFSQLPLNQFLEFPQQFGSSQEGFVLPFEHFQNRKHCQDGYGTICWIFLFLIIFNNSFTLLSHVTLMWFWNHQFKCFSNDITWNVKLNMIVNDAWANAKVKIWHKFWVLVLGCYNWWSQGWQTFPDETFSF